MPPDGSLVQKSAIQGSSSPDGYRACGLTVAVPAVGHGRQLRFALDVITPNWGPAPGCGSGGILAAFVALLSSGPESR